MGDLGHQYRKALVLPPLHVEAELASEATRGGGRDCDVDQPLVCLRCLHNLLISELLKLGNLFVKIAL